MKFHIFHKWKYEDKEPAMYRKCECGKEEKRYETYLLTYDDWGQPYREPYITHWREYINK